MCVEKNGDNISSTEMFRYVMYGYIYDYIIELVDQTLDNYKLNHCYSSPITAEFIDCYINLLLNHGFAISFHNIQEFIKHLHLSKKDQKILIKILNNTEIKKRTEQEMFEFLIQDYFYHEIIKYIDLVLHDSKEDPHYSAVTTTNWIKCYIQIMKDHGYQLDYDDVKGFLEHVPLTLEQQQQFEDSRAQESVYYRGKQY